MKSTNRHTPGPWEIAKTSHGSIFVRHPLDHPNHEFGYFVEIAMARDYSRNEENTEANASLIAAAPELLEACKLALSDLKGDNVVDWGVVEALESAIAKAEGAA